MTAPKNLVTLSGAVEQLASLHRLPIPSALQPRARRRPWLRDAEEAVAHHIPRCGLEPRGPASAPSDLICRESVSDHDPQATVAEPRSSRATRGCQLALGIALQQTRVLAPRVMVLIQLGQRLFQSLDLSFQVVELRDSYRGPPDLHQRRAAITQCRRRTSPWAS